MMCEVMTALVGENKNEYKYDIKRLRDGDFLITPRDKLSPCNLMKYKNGDTIYFFDRILFVTDNNKLNKNATFLRLLSTNKGRKKPYDIKIEFLIGNDKPMKFFDKFEFVNYNNLNLEKQENVQACIPNFHKKYATRLTTYDPITHTYKYAGLYNPVPDMEIAKSNLKELIDAIENMFFGDGRIPYSLVAQPAPMDDNLGENIKYPSSHTIGYNPQIKKFVDNISKKVHSPCDEIGLDPSSPRAYGKSNIADAVEAAFSKTGITINYADIRPETLGYDNLEFTVSSQGIKSDNEKPIVRKKKVDRKKPIILLENDLIVDGRNVSKARNIAQENLSGRNGFVDKLSGVFSDKFYEIKDGDQFTISCDVGSGISDSSAIMFYNSNGGVEYWKSPKEGIRNGDNKYPTYKINGKTNNKIELDEDKMIIKKKKRKKRAKLHNLI